MEITTRKYGNKLIELTIIVGNTEETVDPTTMDGKVPEYLIEQFQEVVNDMLEHNKNLKTND